MDFTNRIDRLSAILTLLSQGNKLITPQLSKQFNVTNKIIQTDFKEYILPIFDDGTISYDYSIKGYLSKNNFLAKTFLSADELSIISILKNKSRDKYSDNDLSKRVDLFFNNYKQTLLNSIYTYTEINSNTINIESNKSEDLIEVELFLDKEVSANFIKNPILLTQKVLNKYDDGSCDILLVVTNFDDIIHIIQKYMPHIGVKKPMELNRIVKTNLFNYLRNFD